MFVTDAAPTRAQHATDAPATTAPTRLQLGVVLARDAANDACPATRPWRHRQYARNADLPARVRVR